LVDETAIVLEKKRIYNKLKMKHCMIFWTGVVYTFSRLFHYLENREERFREGALKH